MFHDQYLDKEENSKLQEVIFRWLTTDDVSLNSIDADDPEVCSVAVQLYYSSALYMCTCAYIYMYFNNLYLSMFRYQTTTFYQTLLKVRKN